MYLGNEFKGPLKRFLNETGIKHILTSSPEIKANFVERFHRTFRDKLSRHMTYYKQRNWTKVFQTIIDQYNLTPHSSLVGLAPNDVNLKNTPALFYRMYDRYFRDSSLSVLNKKKRKFDVGDPVRVAIKQKGFQKASDETFTDEIFHISEILNTYPVTYHITDSNGKQIIGAYYNEELQLTSQF